jgi:exopolyphosphatase/guanosine-5'-triphosphate,3'-diphosphate pyrophosphatase
MTVASIDIGTNTILLLIAEVKTGTKKIKVVKNLHSIPRIGKGLTKGSPFPEENIKRMFDVLVNYSNEINNFNCEEILVTGTNAFRIASNSEEIINKIKTKFGFELNVITGEEEAKYSYLGAVSEHLGNQRLLVIDIGGGSTEIIYGIGTRINYCKSFTVGAVVGTENYFNADPPSENEIKNLIDNLHEIFKEITDNVKEIDTTIAIAGTPTTLACIKHKLETYDEEIIEGSTLIKNDLNNFIVELSQLSSVEIGIKYQDVVKGREDVLLAGTIILNEVSNLLDLRKVKVSTKGIRYGAIINWLTSTST